MEDNEKESRKELVASVRSVSELAKLFKITIPKADEAYYYLDLLSQSTQYANIFEQIKGFIELEKWVKEDKETTVGRYKSGVANDVRDYVKATEAYHRFNKFDMDSFSYTHNLTGKVDDRSKHFDGETVMISIDLNSANYTTFTLFDAKGDMGTSWSDFCSRQKDMHPTLVKAKIFRQVIFGELNSSRNSKIQTRFTLAIYSHLVEKFGTQLADKLIFFSNDELVFTCGKGEEAIRFSNEVTEFLNSGPVPLTCRDPLLAVKAIQLGKHFKATVYRMKSLDESAGKAVKTVLKVEQQEDSTFEFKEDHKTLYGVAASQFFMYFKKYILDQEWEVRDLYFIAEGRLAQWVV